VVGRLGAQGPDFRVANRVGWSGVLPHFIVACAEDTDLKGGQP
jgi:hypothetical protein